jgi:hypothetical protein
MPLPCISVSHQSEFPCHTVTIRIIRLAKMANHFLLEFFRDLPQTAGDILGQLLPLLWRHQPVKVAGLDIIIIDSTFLFVAVRIPGDLQGRLRTGRISGGTAQAVGLVVRVGPAIVVEPHGPVPLVGILHAGRTGGALIGSRSKLTPRR